MFRGRVFRGKIGSMSSTYTYAYICLERIERQA